MKARLLIIDDDSLVVEFLEETFRKSGWELRSSHSAEAALELLKRESFDVVLSDIRLGGMDGITLLPKIKQLRPNAVVIMMTAYGGVETAVLAMKLGAFDFIEKPMSPAVLEVKIQKALAQGKLEREVTTLRLDASSARRDIIGKSKAIRDVFDIIQTAAPTRATALITGESGVGKELFAREMHTQSDRADGPFLKLNCAALNPNLIESELFGHEKGAFTGAIQARSGRFELAQGGTLLLDEISELPIETQAKLLRVLQEREVEKVGSADSISVDVRIIASSNRDLQAAIADGTFRSDLYYRLNVITIDVPPLRKRREDIPALAEFFNQKYSEENKRPAKPISECAYELFMKYFWPGNVRELENRIQEAVVLSKGDRITAEDFSLDMRTGLTPLQNNLEFERMTLHDVERHLIVNRIKQYSGNKTDAARSLGVAARTIRNKLKEYSGEGPNDNFQERD
ncbi:MAG: sigma-54-dependent Fis family transcriptional regulator [candidate division Zixibacteria bacterium]|nr:sigma-54-dependent Fis family transcriptional regulator [candidate division Zixibacteria bacterium]